MRSPQLSSGTVLSVVQLLAFLVFWMPAHAAPSQPLPVPGWKIELVAESPRVQHPSVVCTAPDGRIFVAEDPMDIKAPADSRQGRILTLFPDGTTTVFATNLHAVFGMQYLEGHLYVLHNPRFTRFRDDNGQGRDPFDLIESTLPNPWALDWNDHVPANFRLAMDGYFYVAVGDKGLYQCRGRDGSTVQLRGGGILRLRPDGTALEIYSSGVRNILDVGRDAEDELFTYDNTDEHQWMGRLTHMVDGGFYGYPHDFIPQRRYTLWMMHDFGAGAATGVDINLEDGLADEFKDNLFLADFGKRQVTRVVTQRSGASFRVVRHEDLFREVPEDFRPVGIAWSGDGRALYLCDWQHRDVKAQASVGRLWRLAPTNTSPSSPRPSWWVPLAMGKNPVVQDAELVAALTHASHGVRLAAQRALQRKGAPAATIIKRVVLDTNFGVTARIHALWALDSIDQGQSLRDHLPELLLGTNTPLARQMARQAGNRRTTAAEPILAGLIHRKQADPSLRFQAASALGRIAMPQSIPFLIEAMDESDLFLRHALFRALQRIGQAHPNQWTEIARGLLHSNDQVREGTGFAMRGVYDPELVRVLVNLLRPRSSPPGAKTEAARRLRDIHHRTPDWRGEWWAYHPAKAPPPAKSEPWSETLVILKALRTALSDSEPTVREAAAAALGEARDEESIPLLIRLAESDDSEGVRRAAIDAILAHDTVPGSSAAAALIRSTALRDPERLQLVSGAARLKGSALAAALSELVTGSGSGIPLRTAAARSLGALADPSTALALIAAAGDSSETVRMAALESMPKIGGTEVVATLSGKVRSGTLAERLAAVRGLGQIPGSAAIPPLLEAWANADLQREAVAALSRFSDLRALPAYMQGLSSADPALRERIRKSMMPIRNLLLPEIAARNSPLTSQVLAELKLLFAGDSTALEHPLFSSAPSTPGPEDYTRAALEIGGDLLRGQALFFDEAGVACSRCHTVAGMGGAVGPDLTLAGTQFSKSQLIESVLEPSRAVREGYQQVIVETRDGEEVSGALKADTGDGVTLIDASGNTNFILRATIANRRTSEKSLMPDGLHAGLLLDQFRDLIAFVASRTSDPRLKAPEVFKPEGFQSWLPSNQWAGWRRLSGEWTHQNGWILGRGPNAKISTERSFPKMELRLIWRLPGNPKWVERQYGLATRRHLDAGAAILKIGGDPGLRLELGSEPEGSGGLEGAAKPVQNLDRPIGDWNKTSIKFEQGKVSVEMNGVVVVSDATIPAGTMEGGLGLEVKYGSIQVGALFVR